MTQTDWFRRSTWTPEDEAEFRAKLRRAKPAKRSQYLRIQAGHLQDSGRPELLSAALTLLDEFLAAYPDDLQVATGHWQRARVLVDLGRSHEALAAFRSALDAQRRRPTIMTTAYLDYAELVLALRLVDRFPDVGSALDEFGGQELFPVERYRASAAQALLADAQGDEETAREHARRALAAAAQTEPPFPRHAGVGLVRMVDPEVVARLKQLAAA